MAIELLNGSLILDIFFEKRDREYEDNICLQFKESGPDEEKIFYANETYLYITPEQARQLSQMLNQVADTSSHATR